MAGGVMTTGLRQMIQGEPVQMTQQVFKRSIGGGRKKIARLVPGVADLTQRGTSTSGIFGAASPPTSR